MRRSRGAGAANLSRAVPGAIGAAKTAIILLDRTCRRRSTGNTDAQLMLGRIYWHTGHS